MLTISSPTTVVTYTFRDVYTDGRPCWIARRSDVEEIGILGYGDTPEEARLRLTTILRHVGYDA